MGPDPKKKKIPIHNATLTGRAGNNNSATEMMHYITMEERFTSYYWSNSNYERW